MTLTTRLTTRLGIPHPIMLAPMDVVATGRLAAAVRQAGGFGIIGGGYGDKDWLSREMDAAGPGPLGVGFITWSLASKPEVLDYVLERRPAAIMLSFGDIKLHATRIKRQDCLVICQVQTIQQAKQAVANGVDVLVAQGAEAGGHGISRGTFALVPAVVDVAQGIPVVAAGGVADGRGLAAALMLGAEGVLVGTRFYASQEAGGHPRAKERIVAADGDGTVRGILFDIARRNIWPAPYTGRVLKNAFAEEWRGREAELMQRHEEAERYQHAREKGDFDVAAVIAGEVVDLIHDIPPAKAIIDRMIDDATALLGTAKEKFAVAG